MRAFLGLALALLLPACGDSGLNCGSGTVEKDGQCVLVADTAEADADADTDADADADADGDTDTDTDADTDVPVDGDGDGYSVEEDCDDGNAAANPGAVEICDPEDVDEDCDGLSDDSDPSVSDMSAWYLDADGDGYGASSGSVAACDAPRGARV